MLSIGRIQSRQRSECKKLETVGNDHAGVRRVRTDHSTTAVDAHVVSDHQNWDSSEPALQKCSVEGARDRRSYGTTRIPVVCKYQRREVKSDARPLRDLEPLLPVEVRVCLLPKQKNGERSDTARNATAVLP